MKYWLTVNNKIKGSSINQILLMKLNLFDMLQKYTFFYLQRSQKVAQLNVKIQ